MKSPGAESRAGVRGAREPKAQALLETSADVIGGLIKAFDDYRKKSEIEWDRLTRGAPTINRSESQRPRVRAL
jgi:hypothetical protein